MNEQRVSHGRPAAARTLGPYTVTEAYYAPNQKVPLHAHAWPSWTFVLSGIFEERFARRDAVCTPGSVLTKSATADHSNRYGPEGARCLLIETRDTDREIDMTTAFETPTVFSDGIVPELARQIHEQFPSSDAISGFSIEALIIELAAATGRSSRTVRAVGSKAWLNSVRDQLEAEFRSPPSLGQLADSHRVHPVYLCQAFRRTFGITIGEFVRAVRFEWARDALRVGTGSIAEIAYAAGFSDQAHLSRDFRRNAGISPGRFRAQNAQRD